MFDIGFSELLVIAVVALIVIGPERLPKVARTLGHLFGRMQRYVNDVKADISREMELDELRKLQSNVEEAARAIQGSVDKEIRETQSELDKVAEAANPVAAISESPATPEPAPQSVPHPQPALEIAPGTDPKQPDLAVHGTPPPPQRQA